MNSPYMGKFRVSQQYKKTHTGLDLVGVDGKEIHSTINGVVDYAGWENASNHKQGFGLYVRVKGNDGHYYYFGHLSELRVRTGQAVKITDTIGIEGSTGRSTGSHCHYEIRKRPGVAYAGTVNVSEVSGIPNACGTYDDGSVNKTDINIADKNNAAENKENKANYEVDFFIDMELYSTLYKDLQDVFKGDVEKLKEHYNKHGKAEGRIASYVFDPDYYLKQNWDLKGMNAEEAYNHFAKFGIKEGRKASEIFDVKYYISNNWDLANMTNEQAYEHFLKCGINEGRATSAEFDVRKYREKYKDLQDTFGDNWKEYFKHYLVYGRKEGRQGK